MRNIFLIILSSLFTNLLFTQKTTPLSDLSTLRDTSIIIAYANIHLDSLLIVPSSVIILEDGKIVNPNNYQIHGQTLSLDSSYFNLVKFKKISIQYRVLGPQIHQKYYHLDTSQLKKPEDQAVYVAYDFSEALVKNESPFIRSSGLNYDGSFTRGFSFGNSQSLVLNSNFNLQLSGDLGNDLSIQAAISDANLPIQPEGNTQLLQDFDQVYIHVQKNNTRITAGDYTLEKPAGYFMNYYKKLKGLKVEQSIELDTNRLLLTSANFAVSRGKFARYQLATQEGNQGPYRLMGPDGERILKILSGTERVFLDGILLKRGIENDYIISYDRAEIQFTPDQLITKDKRVTIEFEYADQNYLRTQIASNTNLKAENYQLYVNFYNEQDSKNTLGNIELDSLDRSILSSSGDQFRETYRSGIQTYDPEQDKDLVLYTKRFEPSIEDSVLVYESNPDIARYSVTFSEFGPGKGSYSIANEIAANGRAYKWVGIGQGEFEPLIQLIAPEQRQMLSFGGTLNIAQNTGVNAEFSLSHNDLNRFSDLGDSDNTGIAFKGGFSQLFRLHSAPNAITIKANGSLEYVQQHFKALNPYRNTEFDRDWNLDFSDKTDEIITSLSTIIEKTQIWQLNYDFSLLDRKSVYRGEKQDLGFRYSKDQFLMDGKLSLLNTSSLKDESNFLRPNLRIEKGLPWLKNTKLGVYFEEENNKRKQLNQDDLSASSFRFTRYNAYLENDVSRTLAFKFSWNQRRDFLPEHEDLLLASIANDLSLSSRWEVSESSSLKFNLVHRQLKIQNSKLTELSDKNSFLGSLDYNLQAINGAINSSTSLQVISGQEPRSEFEYIEVRNGEGQYIWLDDGDGVQQVNEFQLAPVQDTANFVKVVIFNNEFIRTQKKDLNQSVRIDFRKLFKGNPNQFKGLKSLLSKFSSMSSVRINQKILDDSLHQKPSFFNFGYKNPNLVSYLSSFNHTVFFNRGNPAYDIQGGIRRNRNRIIQITGYEQFTLLSNFIDSRFSLNRGTDILFNMNWGTKASESQFFERNTYSIQFFKIGPEINFRPVNTIRLEVKYEYQNKQNQLSVLDNKAISHELSFKTNVRALNRSSLNTSLSLINMQFDGEENSPAGLAILEGLRKGQNLLWNVNYTRRVSANVDMIFSYDGRKTGNSRTIHAARAQVKATF